MEEQRTTYFVKREDGSLIAVAQDGPWEQLVDIADFEDHQDVYTIKTYIDVWGEMWELKENLGYNVDSTGYVERNYIEDVEFKDRLSIFCKLTTPYAKEHDFIEITGWSNGEGFDITISDKPVISLHESELEVINVLVKKLTS